jgi:endo-1,4-beta-mannosidase
MFKAMMACIILALMFLAGYAIYKVFQGDKPIQKQKPDSPDLLIMQLKASILDAERECKQGIENAEAKLEYYKKLLEKALDYKQKFN